MLWVYTISSCLLLNRPGQSHTTLLWHWGGDGHSPDAFCALVWVIADSVVPLFLLHGFVIWSKIVFLSSTKHWIFLWCAYGTLWGKLFRPSKFLLIANDVWFWCVTRWCFYIKISVSMCNALRSLWDRVWNWSCLHQRRFLSEMTAARLASLRRWRQVWFGRHISTETIRLHFVNMAPRKYGTRHLLSPDILMVQKHNSFVATIAISCRWSWVRKITQDRLR